jgi:hypothetical protein
MGLRSAKPSPEQSEQLPVITNLRDEHVSPRPPKASKGRPQHSSLMIS